MKKITLCCFMAIFLSLSFYPLQSNAATKAAPSSLVAASPAEATEAKTLLLRLNEIKTMDKTKLNSSEKKNLRKEVRSIKTQLKAVGGGVYLSVGALLIVILLLLLLL
jgi:hypothetical protein